MSADRFTCPGCGFRTRRLAYFGSYLICEVCEWEDDGVQLANPTSGGGANRESLADHQRTFLSEVPLELAVFHGFTRDQSWRPLSADEVREAEERRAQLGLWNRKAIVELGEAYWAARASS